MPRFIGGLLTARGVAAFWLLYALAFVIMLLAVSPGRTLQDALSAELLQNHLAGGYQIRNPPLYEWLLWSVQQGVGPGPLSYIALRYALIAGIGVLFYAAVRRTVADQRLVAAFSLSLLLFFWFGWDAHHSVSHTLALLAATLALFIMALAYAEQRTVARALGLGLVIGLGLMAKWSFLLVLMSLGVALVLCPETRRVYKDPRSLLIPIVAALPVLPYIRWLLQLEPALLAVTSVPPGGGVPPERVIEGIVVFTTGIPLVMLPWILFVLFFASRFPKKPASEAPPQHSAIRVALAAFCVGLALMGMILVGATLSGTRPFGITRFAIHYLYPFCLFAAIGLAGLVAFRVRVESFGLRLVVTSLIAALAIFIIKLASFTIVPDGAEATILLPYSRLAQELEARGLGMAQFVTLSPRDAGNLTIYLPQARALCLSARLSRRRQTLNPTGLACCYGAASKRSRRILRRHP